MVAMCMALMSCDTKDKEAELADVMTAEEVAAMAPEQIVQDLLAGNARFVEHRELRRHAVAQVRASAEKGQHPQAIVLSCIDSRVPVELLFDKGVGDIFVTRVAGNVISDDILGSMEYACGHSSAKVVMVLGHSDCGAVHAAVSGADGGNMSAMLAKIHPAIDSCRSQGLKDGSLEQAVVLQNVRNMMARVREQSAELAHLEQAGKITIVGAVFDLATGRVTLVD